MMGQIKGYFLGGIFGALLVFIGTEVVNANEGFYDDLFKSCMNNVAKDCESWALKGGGSGAPRGLTKDSKAELAMGERYILNGKIDIADNTPYLHISFAKHPWLANAMRVKNPFYRLKDDTYRWMQFRGKEVTIVVNTRYSAWVGNDGRTMLEVFLVPTPEPLIDAIQPLQTRR